MATDADWRSWWRVGCGVESLHDVLRSRGVVVTLDEVLGEALDADGYRSDVGWRHHALVEVARHHGVAGEVCPPLSIDDVQAQDSVDWIISVRAPEQFGATTHLVRVTPRDGLLHIFWPQGQIEHGARFAIEPGWLAPRMTGRGMRFA